ncbi:hypothetical protein GCM10023198_30300 [Promicromonospora umidemergens]|uniref:Uncharacterized protein n=1 Tax=Promicromonospora umidemergens TaxID=629679 RepID=A0ABP8XF27_9MICO
MSRGSGAADIGTGAAAGGAAVVSPELLGAVSEPGPGTEVQLAGATTRALVSAADVKSRGTRAVLTF